MGTEYVRIEATANISRHNSPRDDEHKLAWMLFVTRVQRLAETSTLNIEVQSSHSTDDLLPSGY